MKPTLHYIFDPLCGWCYAAAPLVESAVERLQGHFDLALHGGGLFGAPAPLPEPMVTHIRQAVKRVHQLSGQAFEPPFLDRLLDDRHALWSSLPAISAVMAVARTDPFAGVKLLSELQRLHFQEGHLLNDVGVFSSAAQRIGWPASDFEQALDRVTPDDVTSHTDEARQLLGRVGGVGFPTFVVESHGHLTVVPHAQHYGHPDGFVSQLAQMLRVDAAERPA